MGEAIQHAMAAHAWEALVIVFLLAWLEYVFPPVRRRDRAHGGARCRDLLEPEQRALGGCSRVGRNRSGLDLGGRARRVPALRLGDRSLAGSLPGALDRAVQAQAPGRSQVFFLS